MSGAPTKYDTAYCDSIVEHCSDGASITSFAAEIGVCRDTITEWVKVHPEFSLAVKRAKASACAWWEKQARTITEKGGGNATLAIFGMKNMGADDWAETTRQEHSGPNGSPIESRKSIDLTGASDEVLRFIASRKIPDADG